MQIFMLSSPLIYMLMGIFKIIYMDMLEKPLFTQNRPIYTRKGPIYTETPPNLTGTLPNLTGLGGKVEEFFDGKSFKR